MNYSLEKISTVEACDTLLASAQKKKRNLDRRRRNLGETIVTYRQRVDQLSNEMAEVQLLLNGLTPVYEALPQGGKYKASINLQIKRLELRLARLQKKAFTCNVRALLAKELRYNMLSRQVAAADVYITAVQNHKTQLENGADFLQLPAVRQKSQAEKSSYKIQTRFSRSPVATSKRRLYKMIAKQGLVWNALTREQKNKVLLPIEASTIDKNLAPMKDIIKTSA